MAAHKKGTVGGPVPALAIDWQLIPAAIKYLKKKINKKTSVQLAVARHPRRHSPLVAISEPVSAQWQPVEARKTQIRPHNNQ